MPYIFIGVMLPFIGTAVGAAAVFFITGTGKSIRAYLGAVASGVMLAASVWSLIIPAVDMCENMGRLAFLPVLAGILSGFGVIISAELFTDKIKTKNQLRFLAVTLHNFPEGMAVGMMFALWLAEGKPLIPVAPLAFSLAITLQNIPEGAIISMPAFSHKKSKAQSFLLGVLSGAVEPLGALLTLVFTGLAQSLLPFMFGFAAGAMLCALCEELSQNEKGHPAGVPLCFLFGFCIMMSLDVALG